MADSTVVDPTAHFEELRRKSGLILAPLVFFAVLLLPSSTLSPEAHRLAAVVAVVITLWVTEALPLAVTALLGPVLAVMLQVAPVRTAFAPMANPLSFLFIGSFILALVGLDEQHRDRGDARADRYVARGLHGI